MDRGKILLQIGFVMYGGTFTAENLEYLDHLTGIVLHVITAAFLVVGGLWKVYKEWNNIKKMFE